MDLDLKRLEHELEYSTLMEVIFDPLESKVGLEIFNGQMGTHMNVLLHGVIFFRSQCWGVEPERTAMIIGVSLKTVTVEEVYALGYGITLYDGSLSSKTWLALSIVGGVVLDVVFSDIETSEPSLNYVTWLQPDSKPLLSPLPDQPAPRENPRRR